MVEKENCILVQAHFEHAFIIRIIRILHILTCTSLTLMEHILSNEQVIKAIGGVRGQKYKLDLNESAHPYEFSAFYRLLKFNRVLKICFVKVRPIAPKYAISLYNLY